MASTSGGLFRGVDANRDANSSQIVAAFGQMAGFLLRDTRRGQTLEDNWNTGQQHFLPNSCQ